MHAKRYGVLAALALVGVAMLNVSAEAKANFTKIHVAGDTYVFGMNDDGAVTGYYRTNGVTHGFYRAAGGKITSFDPPDCVGRVDDQIVAGGPSDEAARV